MPSSLSSDNKTVHALMLDPSSNDAEQTLNILRNSGLAVRATQVVNEEELTDALARQSWDIFLAKESCPQLPITKAQEIIKQSGRDIPAILISDDFNTTKVSEAFEHGFQSLIPEDDANLLETHVHRELHHLEDRRRRKQAEAQLNEAEKRCELLLANSRDAIAYIHEGMHIYANKSYLELFGFASWDELECMPIMDMIAPDFHESFKDFLRQQSRTTNETPYDFVGVESNGTHFDGSLSLSKASYDGEACIQVLIALRGNEELELQEKLKELSNVDPLTGLATRELLLNSLTEVINNAANNEVAAALAYIEIDQFDEWETKLGLKASDEVRLSIADWLMEVATEQDTIARIGDHTFALLRAESDKEAFKTACDNLLQSFSTRLIEANKQTLSGSLSMGICIINEQSPDAEQVIYDAHAAANRAQTGGGNRVRIFEDAVDGVSTDKQQKEALRQIQEAMETGRAHLLFQPIVKLHGDSQEFFQVLLRIRDEKDEPVPVSQLFPVTQGTKLALKLDYWIIAQALRTLKEHRTSSNQSTRFFVQLSATALEDEEIINYILKTTKAAKISTEAIIYQVDEVDANSHLKQVMAIAQSLSDEHIKLAINRFGSGLAGENLLKHLPADQVPYVRVDGHIIQHDLIKEGDSSKLQETIKLAKDNKRTTIVPMIEEAQTLAQIWPMGIDYVQGFYLSPPSPNLYFDFSEAGL